MGAAALSTEAREIESTFDCATRLHRDGHLVEAERLYRAIVTVQPRHAAANHNLGVIYAQSTRAEEALPLFLAAIEADPAEPQYWLSYIDGLLLANRRDDARLVLAHAVEHGLRGRSVDALMQRIGE